MVNSCCRKRMSLCLVVFIFIAITYFLIGQYLVGRLTNSAISLSGQGIKEFDDEPIYQELNNVSATENCTSIFIEIDNITREFKDANCLNNLSLKDQIGQK